ncbi:uncharacterized protein [Lepeophtheirus salmonis]|uniref:uncharacterized protein n=1 Tax=Lepeophtheirus salmonis TaxID=72036 RepID=UPI001AE7BBE4|nr:leucine zipper putative tumor suppressor 2 homolog [Lepeophtheirus salmonis]
MTNQGPLLYNGGCGPDSGHETLLSEGEDSSPQLHKSHNHRYENQYSSHPVERASSEVIYSTISNASHLGIRSRRSLAEPPSSNLAFNQDLVQNFDIDQPPMIAPISGVPNFKDKAVIRPIAFRPKPITSKGINNNNTTLNYCQPPQPHSFTNYKGNSFSPGHPLIQDGRRHYGSSQELHVHPLTTTTSSTSFNKFNSLDRRALSRRQNLKLAIEPEQPPQQIPSSPSVMPANGLVQMNDRTSSRGFDSNKSNGETNGKLYDRNLTASVSSNGSVTLNSNRLKICDNSSKLSAMNINGLPDPSIYSSQESISNRIPRPGAGTPQFQNLPGVVRTCSNITLGPENNAHICRNYENTPSSISSKSSSIKTNNIYSNGSTIGENETPSPSDSAVGDLEHMLKEKDTEISYLKETMEQNEQVIFKVYEEKEKMWERELRKVKGLYDNRLRLNQQKASKMEQVLTNQTFILQNEKRKLELDFEDVKKLAEERQKENHSFREELQHLRKTLKENEWSSCAKSGEISLLLEQQHQSSSSYGLSTKLNIKNSTMEIKDLKMELERKSSELRDLHISKRSLQMEVLSLKTQLDKKNLTPPRSLGRTSFVDEDDECDEETIRSEIVSQKETIISRDLEIEKLRSDLEEARRESLFLKEKTDRCKENFEVEKAHWLDEKEKVIRYQKQLQLNYVQMYKKNKQLESEIENLKVKKLNNSDHHHNQQPSIAKKASFLSHLTLSKNSSSSGSSSSSSTKSSPSTPLPMSGSSNISLNGAKSKFFKMTLHTESNC